MSRPGCVACLVMAVLLSACVGHTRYHHYQPLPQEGWARQDTMLFHLPDSMPGGQMRLAVELRATRSFPYTDLWLALEQRDSTQRVLHSDTLHISMTDSQGNLSGHGQGLLEYTSAAVPLASDSLGSCREVRLHHLMSQEIIPSLTDIGLQVTCP